MGCSSVWGYLSASGEEETRADTIQLTTYGAATFKNPYENTARSTLPVLSDVQDLCVRKSPLCVPAPVIERHPVPAPLVTREPVRHAYEIQPSESVVPVSFNLWNQVESKAKHHPTEVCAPKPIPGPGKSLPWPNKFHSCEEYCSHFRSILQFELAEIRLAPNAILQKAKIVSLSDSELVLKVSSVEGFSCGDTLYLHRSYRESDMRTICDVDADSNLITINVKDVEEAVTSVTYAMSYVIGKMLQTLFAFSDAYPLADVLLGHTEDLASRRQEACSNYKQELNQAQARAVTNALSHRLTLIQGPPGTGKTRTAAHLVRQFAGQKDGKILVCASSNIAADNLAIAIHKANPDLNMVRLYSHEKEKTVNSATQQFAFHYRLRSRLMELHPTYGKLLALLSNPTRKMMSDVLARSHKDFQREVARFLSESSVVCCTCVTAANRILECARFKYVLLDEAAFSPETETLLAVKDKCEKLVLIGDQKQLPPVVLSDKAKQRGYGRSLFERLIACGVQPMLLNVQYRMLPLLSAYPRKAFYDGKVSDDESVLHARTPLEIRRYFRTSPLVMVNCKGTELRDKKSFSYYNETEVAAVIAVLDDLHQLGVTGQSIGVITAYDAQRRKIVKKMQSLNYKNWVKEVEVKNVDGYQGREKDIIVISTVRANGGGNIGFLADKRRINVALTRAKFGLVLIGNQKVLKRDSTWKKFIAYGRSVGDLIQG